MTPRPQRNCGALSFDYLFVCSNRPAPRSLEKAKAAVDEGRRVLLVYLERQATAGGTHVLPPPSLDGCTIVAFDVSFGRVELRRVWAMIDVARRFRTILIDHPGIRDVYVDALDLLAILQWVSPRADIRFRYEVRDLNRLQLAPGPLPAAIRLLEARLLEGVDLLVLTSERYWTDYYARARRGRYVVVENWPDPRWWSALHAVAQADPPPRPFTITYVGVVRYMRSVSTLLSAVERLRDEGHAVRLLFAGGGDTTRLTEHPLFATGGARHIGAFDYGTEIESIYAATDLNYAVYDPRVQNVRYALPNKLYESILTRIPLLVARGTFLESTVCAAGIGSSVTCGDVDELESVLREAVLGEGWFDRARRALEANPGPTETAVRGAIRDAVVG